MKWDKLQRDKWEREKKKRLHKFGKRTEEIKHDLHNNIIIAFNQIMNIFNWKAYWKIGEEKFGIYV